MRQIGGNLWVVLSNNNSSYSLDTDLCKGYAKRLHETGAKPVDLTLLHDLNCLKNEITDSYDMNELKSTDLLFTEQ
jgi:hypothetical protein